MFRDAEAKSAEQPMLLSTLPPTKGQEKQAIVVASVLFCGFVIAVLFEGLRLPEIDAFVPVVASIAFVNDLITATLLFSQFSSLGSRALYALASGYLLSGLLMVPYVLTFPGAFSPTGLLNAGPQSTVWLFFVWHLTPPTTTLFYVFFKNTPSMHVGIEWSAQGAILKSISVVLVAVFGLTWLVTAHQNLMPAIMQDWTHATPLWNSTLTPLMISLNVLAFLLLWNRQGSLLDLWLLVATWSWLLEAILLHFVNTRWAGNWYLARLFWIASSSIVLLVLLGENTKLYARVVRSNVMLERERNNRLLSLEAATASISHELRQPLTAIGANNSAALALLEHLPPDLNEAKAALRDAHSDIQRIAQTLSGLRALFGKADPRPQPIDLNDVILRVLQVLRGELNEHRIATSVELEPQLPSCTGFGAQLQEVITNLIHNAMNAMEVVEPDRRLLKIKSKLEANRAIVLEVEDSGPGIDVKHLDSVFDVFMTTKPTGTGLGLAICRTIVERHGGQILAVPNDYAGALFRIILPIQADSR